MRHPLLFWLFLNLGVCGLCYGQQTNDPTAAQAKYEEAERYYKLGEFETALPLYREAYLMSGEPELLFNIGQCNRQLKRYEEALKNYNAYLRDVPDSPSRETVERLIQEMESKLSPSSQAASEPTSLEKQPTSTLQPNTNEKKLFTLWQNSAVVKIGVGAAGAGLLLGGVSLLGARAANNEGVDILQATQKKRTSIALAFTSDIIFLAGAACVGTGWVLEKQKQPHVVVQLNSSGAQAALLWEL